MATKFFHQLKTPLRILINMRAPKRNAEGGGQLTLTFRLALDGNIIRSAPEFLRSHYEELKNGASNIDLEKEIDKIDIHLYNLPEHKKAAIRLASLHLEGLALKKVKNSEGDISHVLTFQAEYPWDSAVWEYLGDHYATDVFAKFDSAQAELVDVESDEAAGKKKTKSKSLEFPPAEEGESEPDDEDDFDGGDEEETRAEGAPN